MAAITIRNLDEETKARLRIQAAQNQRSMEEEARVVLRSALAAPRAKAPSLAVAIRRRFRPLGGVEITLPAREPMRGPPRPGK
jgi:plasmid stability protein